MLFNFTFVVLEAIFGETPTEEFTIVSRSSKHVEIRIPNTVSLKGLDNLTKEDRDHINVQFNGKLTIITLSF